MMENSNIISKSMMYTSFKPGVNKLQTVEQAFCEHIQIETGIIFVNVDRKKSNRTKNKCILHASFHLNMNYTLEKQKLYIVQS